MLLVLALTVFVGLIEAVLAGLILSSLLFMKSIADVVEHRTESTPLKAFSLEIPWSDEGNIIEKLGEKVYIKHLDGPLFFGFASQFQEMIKVLPEVRVVVIRMDKVPYIDQSGFYAMEEAVLDLQGLGIKVVFTGLHGQPREMLEKFNLVPGLVADAYCFEDFASAVKWLEGYLTEHHMDTE